METTGLFNQTNQDIKCSQLCLITKDRIESFLPGLWDDLFKTGPKSTISSDAVDTQKPQNEVKPSQDVASFTNSAIVNVDNTKVPQVC